MTYKKDNLKRIFKAASIATFVASLIISQSQASVVRSDVDYQVFRDFGENKGKFQVGAVNIPVYDKSGNLLGTALPKDVPMPDFSFVDSNRYLSGLVSPQYIASVKHNSTNHFVGTKFGQPNHENGIYSYEYIMVDKNDHDNLDYNTPRLHKMVTEVAPAELPENLTAKDLLSGKYIAYARAGSGTQAIQDKNHVTVQWNAYQFPTGGTALKMLNNTGDMVGTVIGHVQNADTSYGPLVSYGAKGDSGSPLLGYDKELKRWVIVGNIAQYYGYGTTKNNYMITQLNFLKQNQQNDTGAILNVRSTSPITWTNSGQGKSRITSELNSVVVDVRNGNDLNNGKDIVIKGKNTTIQLNENINQGAGGLYFLTSGTVKGNNNDITHVGSGIYVAPNQSVEWKVKNPAGDRLSKLGSGDLIVSGNGSNRGDISIGDGTVYLSQNNGVAFNNVVLASGRGKAVLKDDKQANEYRFDYRGGTLDLNGNNLTFDLIKHADDGATIINGNKNKPSTLNLKTTNVERTFLGNIGTTPRAYTLPSTVIEAEDFNGFGNSFDINDFVNNDGVLHLNVGGESPYKFSGNINLKGNVNVINDANISFSGAPTPYASIVTTNGFTPVTVDTDWQNRIVNAANFYVGNNGKINFNRNLTAVNGNIVAQNNSIVNLGTTEKFTEEVYSTIPTTRYEGRVVLRDNAILNVGKAHLNTSFEGDNNSTINLNNNSIITLNDNSSVGKLTMKKGSVINLNPNSEFSRFNTLTVNNSLTGEGAFRFSTDLAKMVANKLVLNGTVNGNYEIFLLDSGREPTSNKGNISIIEVKQPNQNYNFTLNKGHVDAGAYRYSFANGVLTTEKQNVIKENIDPNYKAPDFTKLHKNFTDSKVQNPIKKLLADNNYKTPSYEELIKQLKSIGLINVQLDNNGKILNPELTNVQYNLDRLTPEERKALQETLLGNGVDLSKIDPNTLKDHTPTPKDLPETKLYDKQGAEEEGLKVVDGKIVEDETSLPKLVEVETETAEKVKPTNNTTNQLEIVSPKQRDNMSKYSNSIVETSTVSQEMLQQIQQASQNKLIGNVKDDVWVNYVYNRKHSDNKNYRDSKDKQNLTQIGGLFKVSDKDSFGFTLSDNRSESETVALDDNMGVKQRLQLFEILAKHTYENGFFAVGEVGYGRFTNKYQDNLKAKFNQNVVKFGLLGGVNYQVNNFTITPYLGVQHYIIQGKDFNLEQANVKIKRQNPTILTTGLNIKYDIDLIENVKLQPMISVDYHSKSLGNDSNVWLNNHKFKYQFEDSFTTNLGFNISANKFDFTLTGGLEKSNGYKRNGSLNTSVTYKF